MNGRRGSQQAVAALRENASDTSDQAATLRRLFARPVLRVLPVLLPEQHCVTRASLVARLAQGFARQGERTLVIDAARAQIAATLGLRARWDLAHALRGECALSAAIIDAGTQLSIVPAARALREAIEQGTDIAAWLPSLANALSEGCDLALLMLPASVPVRVLGRLVDADMLVPMLPSAHEIARSLKDIERIAAPGHAQFCASGQHGAPDGAHTTAAFRLLFPGMDGGAAANLTRVLVDRLRTSRGERAVPELRLAGALKNAHDMPALLRAASGWSMAQIELDRGAIAGTSAGHEREKWA